DSGAGDWRFIDQVEGSPTAFGLAFRSMFPGSGYQLAAAGSRHLRVFQTSPDIQQTQVVWFDTTFTLQAGTHYTLLAAGNLRDKTAKMYILTDDFTDPGSQVALRVINTGAGVVDVYASPTGGTSTLPTPFAAGVGHFTAPKGVSQARGGGVRPLPRDGGGGDASRCGIAPRLRDRVDDVYGDDRRRRAGRPCRRSREQP